MEVLRFERLIEGVFLERTNRFTAKILLDGREEDVHVRDSGRLGELLRRGARVLVREKEGGKLRYELIAAFREPYGWVFTNSGYHSKIAEALLEEGLLPEFRDVRGFGKEVRLGKSRIDFVLVYDNAVVPLEVKGCTLFDGDVALFPDAPTERGRRHLREMTSYRSSIVMFLTMTDRVSVFTPHIQNDPEFVYLLVSYFRKNLHVVVPTFRFEGGKLIYSSRIPFLFPVTDDSRLVLNVLKEGEREYNERFSPEANVFVNGLLFDNNPIFTAVFHGYLCISCGLYDYFEDLILVLGELGVKARALDYTSFGNTFVVRYSLTF